MAFTLALVAIALLPSVASQPALRGAFLGAGATLGAWAAGLFAAAARRGRSFVLDIVVRKPHFVQTCAQTSVYLYWGWYWREVYDSAHLIVAQLLFAYAFDMLLTWSRRRPFVLGMGPFPIILSINLFLWFRPDWFYLQFLMIAVGFVAKHFIQWDKDGRRAHIFNPSAFPLALFSLILILTGTTDHTYAEEIAAAFEFPPQMAWWIFAIGLPSQFLFGVTMMTMPAAVAMFTFGVAYLAVFGTYFMVDFFVPTAVFLGMNLLFTDPATSPRTELGRVVYGILYGLSVVALYAILDQAGAPTFYDKLLAVPVLNLMLFVFDRATESGILTRVNPSAVGRTLAPRRRHLAYMTIWALAFVGIQSVEGVGIVARGHSVIFWEQACQDDLRNGCRNLARIEAEHCTAGSGWACNQAGILIAEGRASIGATARAAFQRSCTFGFQPGCQNAQMLTGGASRFVSAQPRLADYAIILRDGSGSVTELPADVLYARACEQGWPDACGRRIPGAVPNPSGAPALAAPN